MGKVLIDHSMSVDGFSTGLNVGVEHPRGDGGEQLHDSMFDRKTDADARSSTTSTRRSRPGGGRLPRRRDEHAQVSHLHLPGWIRSRSQPERGEPARRGRGAAARLGRFAGRPARIAPQAGRRLAVDLQGA